MEKINVVLVVLDGKKFEQALGSLNLNAANLVAVVVEGDDCTRDGLNLKFTRSR